MVRQAGNYPNPATMMDRRGTLSWEQKGARGEGRGGVRPQPSYLIEARGIGGVAAGPFGGP